MGHFASLFLLLFFPISFSASSLPETPEIAFAIPATFYLEQVSQLAESGPLNDASAKIRARRDKQYLNSDKSLLEIMNRSTPSSAGISILISKNTFTLTLLHNEIPQKEYPVVLGFNPVDDKRREGDGCTPEGDFTLKSTYKHDSWSRFMWVDYPTAESYAKHNASKAAGEIPEDASIGGEIGIHGVPGGMDSLVEAGNNWTLGCISLRNADIEEIFEWCEEGTKVRIVH